MGFGWFCFRHNGFVGTFQPYKPSCINGFGYFLRVSSAWYIFQRHNLYGKPYKLTVSSKLYYVHNLDTKVSLKIHISDFTQISKISTNRQNYEIWGVSDIENDLNTQISY